MKKFLVLTFNNDNDKNILLDSITSSNKKVDAACVFIFHNIFLRAIRRWMLVYKVPGLWFWMGKWKYKIKEYDVIICAASTYSSPVLEWIRKKNPSAKIINYYWDKISVSKYPVINSHAYENWSFDKRDCQKYGLFYNAQFYVNNFNLGNKEVSYDISFVGADRGGKWKERILMADSYYSIFLKYGLNTYFYVVSKNPPFQRDYIHEEHLTEEEFYQIMAKSKVILELVQPGEEWITLRPLTALSNGKKLITNNKYIKEERFYSMENVFILGEDENDRLVEFVNTPFCKIEKEDLEYYELSTWLDRFCE